jgi:hypothetical protein
MTKEFKVGDKVWSPSYGNGIVYYDTNNPLEHQIYVTFSDCHCNFTKEGKLFATDAAPTLFHGRNLVLEAREPEKVWVNIYYDPHLNEIWGGLLYDSEENAHGAINIDENKDLYIKTIELTIPKKEK